MVVCNARATSFTKANVTNMCDNWIGKGGSMSVSHNNFFYAHPTPCLPASPLQISAVCNARATPTYLCAMLMLPPLPTQSSQMFVTLALV